MFRISKFVFRAFYSDPSPLTYARCRGERYFLHCRKLRSVKLARRTDRWSPDAMAFVIAFGILKRALMVRPVFCREGSSLAKGAEGKELRLLRKTPLTPLPNSSLLTFHSSPALSLAPCALRLMPGCDAALLLLTDPCFLFTKPPYL